MSALETTFLSEDPSPEEIKARCNDPAVKEYLRLDTMLCKPVCMVTGIKLAKNFRLEGKRNLSEGVAAEVGGEVGPEASQGWRG